MIWICLVLYPLITFLSESRHDKTILAELKREKQMPVEQRDIDAFCKSHSFKYFETSAETGYGVEACLHAAVSIIKEHHTSCISCYTRFYFTYFTRFVNM